MGTASSRLKTHKTTVESSWYQGVFPSLCSAKLYFPLLYILTDTAEAHTGKKHSSGTCKSSRFQIKNNTNKCNIINTILHIFFLPSSCDRLPLNCFSPTFPLSSLHISCSGRKWFIPCYRKSGGQKCPLTLWSWSRAACRYESPCSRGVCAGHEVYIRAVCFIHTLS